MTSTARAPRHRSTDPSLPHEHGWCVESRHATSLGVVLYVRCAVCGIRRVDVQPSAAQLPPSAVSGELGARDGRGGGADERPH